MQKEELYIYVMYMSYILCTNSNPSINHASLENEKRLYSR